MLAVLHHRLTLVVLAVVIRVLGVKDTHMVCFVGWCIVLMQMKCKRADEVQGRR
jgi:hypothetical protein